MTQPVYLTDTAGEVWRVYDVAYGPIHRRRGPSSEGARGEHSPDTAPCDSRQ